MKLIENYLLPLEENKSRDIIYALFTFVYLHQPSQAEHTLVTLLEQILTRYSKEDMQDSKTLDILVTFDTSYDAWLFTTHNILTLKTQDTKNATLLVSCHDQAFIQAVLQEMYWYFHDERDYPRDFLSAKALLDALDDYKHHRETTLFPGYVSQNVTNANRQEIPIDTSLTYDQQKNAETLG